MQKVSQYSLTTVVRELFSNFEFKKKKNSILQKKVDFWFEMSFTIEITPFMSLHDLQIINNLIR